MVWRTATMALYLPHRFTSGSVFLPLTYTPHVLGMYEYMQQAILQWWGGVWRRY